MAQVDLLWGRPTISHNCVCIYIKLERKYKHVYVWVFWKETRLWDMTAPVRAGKSTPCTFRSTRTLTHAAQMLEAAWCDALELETGSFHTWRELQRLPPAADYTHHQQSHFTALTLLPASPGDLPLVIHSSWNPLFPPRMLLLKVAQHFLWSNLSYMS